MTRIHCKVYNLSYNLRRKEIKQIGIKIKLQPNTKASQKLKKTKETIYIMPKRSGTGNDN